MAFGLINMLERNHKEDVKDERQIDVGDDFIFKQNIGAAPIHSWDPRNGTFTYQDDMLYIFRVNIPIST